MGLRSDTHRCRALVYGVERSSYQANVAPKGDPHLSSVPHGCTAHTWHGRSRLTGTPQGWALMISPLAYAGATAGMGVAAGVGRQACRQARSQGGESVPVSGGERAGQVGGGTAGAGAAGAVGAGAVMAG